MVLPRISSRFSGDVVMCQAGVLLLLLSDLRVKASCVSGTLFLPPLTLVIQSQSHDSRILVVLHHNSSRFRDDVVLCEADVLLFC